MANYKEIVTKAVIGKGKKSSQATYQVETDETPDTVLGCWVINHNFRGQNNRGTVLVTGAYDVNVWYSYDHDTKTTVSTKRFTYDDKMNVRLKDDASLTDQAEIIVRSLKQPAVTDVSIANGMVKMNIEKELGVEIVGDTKVKVSVEDDEDDYEEIEDEEEVEAMVEDISNTVTDDYLEDQQ